MGGLELHRALREISDEWSLIVRGIFTLRRWELEWFYQEGCSWIFPDAFADYQRIIPESERGDMIGAYYKLVTHADPEIRLLNSWPYGGLHVLDSLWHTFPAARLVPERHTAVAATRPDDLDAAPAAFLD